MQSYVLQMHLESCINLLQKKKKKCLLNLMVSDFNFLPYSYQSGAKHLMYLNPLAQITERTEYTD